MPTLDILPGVTVDSLDAMTLAEIDDLLRRLECKRTAIEAVRWSKSFDRFVGLLANEPSARKRRRTKTRKQ